MAIEVDVLIVGGGPAGLAAGIVCASHGLHTMVCEKRQLPVDKACGEGVMPTGLAHLERLGVKRYLTSGNYFPFNGIRYISSRGTIASAAFREGQGWGIPRLELSAAMLRRSRELDCLEIHAAEQALPLEVDEKRERVLVQVGGHRVRARLLIGADGLNSLIRRWAGLQGPRGTYQRWGVRQHFEISPWSTEVEIHWGTGLEAYITPCGKNLVDVAFLWDRQRRLRLPGGHEIIPALLKFLPALHERLKHAHPHDKPLAVGPMQRIATRPVADAVLLIGDAAGYLDALTGEGISLALAEALALEETVLPLLTSGREGPVSRRELGAYERAYHVIVRPYYALTHLILWLSRHPNLAEQAIGLLRLWPGLFQRVLSANMETLPRRRSA